MIYTSVFPAFQQVIWQYCFPYLGLRADIAEVNSSGKIPFRNGDIVEGMVVDMARRRGRPMDTDIEHVVLRATVELLGERGFDRFTVQDIADRAGTGLGAIYRRWPGKLHVVVAAIRTLVDEAPCTPTGDTETDLARELELRVRRLRGCLGAILPGLLTAMHDHPDLAALVHERAIGPGLDRVRAILAPAFPDPVELQLRTEMANGILLHRLLVTHNLPKPLELRERIVPLILGRPMSQPRRRQVAALGQHLSG
jgi:AcrR family transcriptional regulator